MSQPQSEHVRFTCLSCAIIFASPVEQRAHYRSDFHRYNMKRRIAALPPVPAGVFDSKVIGHQPEMATASTKDFLCAICNKIYTTEGPYKSHIHSKKHLEKQNKVDNPIHPPSPLKSSNTSHFSTSSPLLQSQDFKPVPVLETNGKSLAVEQVQVVEQSIDEKIAAAHAKLSPVHCLFCPIETSSLESNLTHMFQVHSFFVPDADYLIDLPGLIDYLGEKVAVGNVCLFCNDRGREFRTLDAVRKHMVDKSHCKIAYDSVEDRLDLSAFYDFTSSYPDAKATTMTENEETWEDVISNGSEVDEVVDANGSSPESESDDDLPDNEITYGDSHLELVLPSGTRIGHRAMRRYYAQNPGAVGGRKFVDSNSGAAVVRRLLADKNSALVPLKGGFGAFGMGTQAIVAKNKGEAREAGRHVREFRDQRRREEFKTKVGFIANSQKHYRDPCN